jgi:hypothetical protein
MKTLLLGITMAIALGATTGCSHEKTIVRRESVTSVPADSTVRTTTTVTDPAVVERRTTERRTTEHVDY